MTSIKIKQDINALAKAIGAFKLKLKGEIRNLPDNPNADRIQKGCIVTSFHEVMKHDNLSPYFHDFKYQYEYLIKIIDNADLYKLLDKLERIAETGKYREYNGQYFKFHPTVVEHIKKLF